MNKLTRNKLPLYEGTKTGGMGRNKFLELKESIKNDGLTNPIIIEQDQNFRIAMGHNRVEAMEQLGHTHIKAVLLVQGIMIMHPGHKGIPNRFFEERMHSLHPGDDTWRLSQWAKRVLKSCKQELEVAM
ncbi:MAG: ParB/Srx family N-terminal domain-containing protein [Nitrosomonadaceae bacterium]